MRQHQIPLTTRLFLIFTFILLTVISLTKAAAAKSYPEEWVVGDRLLVGFMFLIVLGWLTGAYALLMGNVVPTIRRSVLYPLFKIVGMDGDKKPLIREK